MRKEQADYLYVPLLASDHKSGNAIFVLFVRIVTAFQSLQYKLRISFLSCAPQ